MVRPREPGHRGLLCPLLSSPPRSDGTADKNLLPLITPSAAPATALLPHHRAPSPDLISALHTRTLAARTINLLPCPTQFPEMHGLLLKPPWGKTCQPGCRHHCRHHCQPLAKAAAASPAQRHLCKNKGVLGRVEGEAERSPWGHAQEMALPPGVRD